MAYSLPPALESHFQNSIVHGEPGRLSKAILHLSDFYLERPGQPTPWGSSDAFDAYLAYFLPLNIVRLIGAWREVERFLSADEISEIWDFGSGIGATHWCLEAQSFLSPRRLLCVERDLGAREKHRDLCEKFCGLKWQPEWPSRVSNVSKGALAVFSFSFVEMATALPDLGSFDHILLVEPSMREHGRQLLEQRARLIDQGYVPLAPCTHFEACPLLTESPRDWCHHRVHFQGSQAFLRLEDHLPMKNRTLTFSYLLMSRTHRAHPWAGAVRVIGDTLKEKGKTRQMICRSPRREFLSWLHKDGEPPFIPHGALIRELGEHESKSKEIRPHGELKFEV